MSHTFTKNSLRGFTLIELLVVIAIIGLLSTVIAAPITQARKKGRDGKKVADLHQLVGALQQYADDHASNYPYSLDGLVPTYLALLPPNAATSTSPKDKYMYVMYETNSTNDVRQVGFHMGTKLEAPNLSLGDDRDCHGVGTITITAKFCQDPNADASGVVAGITIRPGNLSTTIPVLVTDASFANDSFGMPAGPATFQSNDFQGGSENATTSCTAMVKGSTAAGTCIYDIGN